MAEEIINIATLTVDNTRANESAAQTKKAIFDLQAANSDLRKDIKANGDATGEQTKKFVENEQELKRLSGQYKIQSAALNDLTLAELKSNASLTDTVKSRAQAIEQTKQLKEVRQQLDVTTKEGAEALNLLNKKIDENDKFLKTSGSTQEQAATITGNYRQALFGVDQALAKFGVSGEQARNVVSGFGSGVKDTYNEIGNFTAKTGAAISSTLGFKTASQLAAEQEISTAVATEAVTTATEAQAVATNSATVATTASTLSLKAFTVALVSTGVGAIVVALGLLINYLTSTQAGIDKVTSVTRPLVAVFQSLLGVAQTLGEKLFNTFSEPKKAISDLVDFIGNNLLNRVKAFGVILDGVLNFDPKKVANGILQIGTGVENTIGKVQKAGQETSKFFNDALAKGQALDKLEKNLEKTRNKNVLLIGEATEEVKAQNRIAEDQTKTSKQREVATQLSIVAGKEINRLKNNELDIEIAILKNKQSRNDTSRAEEKDLNELIKKKNENNAQELELTTTQTNKLNGIRKEAQAKAATAAKEAQDKRIKAAENDIAIERAKNSQLAKTDEERLKFLAEITRKETDLIKLKLSTGTITAKEAKLATIQIASEQSKELLTIAQETIASELKEQQKAVTEKKKLTEEQKNDEIANAEFLKSVQTQRIQDSAILESEKVKALLEIQNGYQASVDVINTNYEASRKQAEATARQEAKTLEAVEFETRQLLLEEQGLSELEIQQTLLDLALEQKLAALDAELIAETKTAEEVRAIKELEEKKYAAATKKIDDQVKATKRKAQFEIAATAIGAAQQIFGESKALAVASALLNTYQGITAELSTKAVTPYEIGLKVANVAFVASSGFAAVKNILKTDKGATGGSASGTTTPTAVFENTARTQSVASVDPAPSQDNQNRTQMVLVVETLDEAKKQQQIKVNSN